jgi:hypothetical protein
MALRRGLGVPRLLARGRAAVAGAWAEASSGTRSAGPSFTTPEEFELELAELGLSGKTFGPRDYALALERRLGIRIVLEIMNDAQHPEFLRRLALSGRIAETHYLPERRAAVVLLPASLPPLVRSLAALHELSHLAAGDHLIGGEEEGGERLARRPPLEHEAAREEEADQRSIHALLAGTLGSASPYAQRIYDAR